MNVVEASGLGKRYGRGWALRECTLAIPAGRVTALVGPNGAGKSTLLNLAVGLTGPSAGAVTVLGRAPGGVACRAGPGRVRGPGHAAVQEPDGRGHDLADPLREPAFRPALRDGPAR